MNNKKENNNKDPKIVETNQQIKIWHYSDGHFHPLNHIYMDEKHLRKGYEYQQYWQQLWKTTVGQNDLVILSGDTVWGKNYKDAQIVLDKIERLPGKKFIIKGNHDQWYTIGNLRRDYFTIIPLDDSWYTIRNLFIVGSKCESVHTQKYRTRTSHYKILSERMKAISSIYDLGNFVKVLVLHYPPETKRLKQLIEKYQFNVVLYGHQHGLENSIIQQGKTVYYRSMIENTGYIPVLVDYIQCNDRSRNFTLNRRMKSTMKLTMEKEK